MANEMRLINANAFSNEWWLAKFVEYKGRLRLVDTKLLRDIPTVDAVPVVRCKECKCSKPTAWYSAKLKCCHPSHMNSQVPHEVLLDHFCSYGERRTDV